VKADSTTQTCFL